MHRHPAVLFCLFVVGLLLFFAVGCQTSGVDSGQRAPSYATPHVQLGPPEASNRAIAEDEIAPAPDFNTEDYDVIRENPFQRVQAHPLSTFSIDVDGASYANARRFIREGVVPPEDAVRVEEFVNYFTYAYPDPDGEHPFSVTMEMHAAPWNPRHQLLHVGLQGQRLPQTERPASNLVFLMDVSGSMNVPNKLPLLKRAFHMLAEEMRPEDRVAIVVYAGASGIVLPSTSGMDKERIVAAIARLKAGGSTAGAAGIELAYAVAQEHFIEGGNNRVILATDGDFNVGISSDAALVRLIEEKREADTFLTVLGFGTGNYKDNKMEKLANHGNGNYYYIDGDLEAKKVLIDELGSTLFAIAKDVKIQVEFNPAQVAAYRLIGYENRMLAAEDFADDKKDAGELGAGHTVTALYEIIPAGAEIDTEVRDAGDLKYQTKDLTTAADSDEWLTVKLRYKEPDGQQSRLLMQPYTPALDGTDPSDDFGFSAAVAGAGMIMRASEHHNGWTTDEALTLARASRGPDAEGYRAGFIDMLESYRRLVALEDAAAARH